MEAQRGLEKPEHSSHEDREQEAAITNLSERIGRLLTQVLDELVDAREMKKRTISTEKENLPPEANFLFRPESIAEGYVHVEAVNLSDNFREENAVLKAFNIALVPGEGSPPIRWHLDEVVARDGVRYRPLFFSSQEKLQDGRELIDESQRFQRPTIQDMERVAQILKDSWESFRSYRRRNAIGYWTT